MKAQNFLILFISCFSLLGCFNKAEIPSNIQTNGQMVVSGETTSHVIHTVEISAQLEELFRAQCESIAIQGGLTRDTAPFETFVSNCIAEKSQEFMTNLLALIQQQQQENEEQTP